MKISILMPAKDGEKWISEAIDSVIYQSYENWELIVVINGSQDNSYKLALQKSKQDDRVKVYNLDKPSKVGSIIMHSITQLVK